MPGKNRVAADEAHTGVAWAGVSVNTCMYQEKRQRYIKSLLYNKKHISVESKKTQPRLFSS